MDETKVKAESHASVSLGVVTLLAAVGLAIFTGFVSADRALTPLESTLFNVALFFLSILGSILISYYFAKEQARQEYVQLARPALRRVVELTRSARAIGDAVRAKADKLGNDVPSNVASEWLDSFERLVDQHSGQLSASVSDWQELLPDDYEALLTISDLVRNLETKLEQLAGVQENQGAEARAREKALLNEIDALRRKLDKTRRSTPVSSPPGVKQFVVNDDLLELLTDPARGYVSDETFKIGSAAAEYAEQARNPRRLAGKRSKTQEDKGAESRPEP